MKRRFKKGNRSKVCLFALVLGLALFVGYSTSAKASNSSDARFTISGNGGGDCQASDLHGIWDQASQKCTLTQDVKVDIWSLITTITGFTYPIPASRWTERAIP